MKKIICLLLSISMLFCVCMVNAGAADDSISRIVVTVNGDSATQKGISWYTASESATKVVIYDAAGNDITSSLKVSASCTEWQGSYSHKATVSGLTAGESYTYKVGDGANWSDIRAFATDDGDDVVNFITVGDVQASNEESFDAGAKVLAKAFETLPEADFYASMGDFTNDCTNEQWDMYFNSFNAINADTTLVPITGNHDRSSNWFDNLFNLDTSESVQTKNGVNYSFDYGNTHFAVVNTNDMGAVSDSQLTWLTNDMNSTSADWKVVFMHKTPYSLGKDGKWPDAQYLQESLAGVCDATDVDLVMSGHDHMYIRTKSLYDNTVKNDNSGTVYVLGGTAGTKRYEIRDFAIENFLPTAFVNTLVVQKSGYGNYFNGTDYTSVDENNIGGCFTTVSIDGGNLTLKAYILSDENETLKQIDEMTLTKEQGLNKATFSGKNTTSSSVYALDMITSAMHLARYAITTWLPRFIKAIPQIISTYVKTGTF